MYAVTVLSIHENLAYDKKYIYVQWKGNVLINSVSVIGYPYERQS